MHLRGKSFRFTAIYPDQTREILLDVPRYDFNWQNTYLFQKPMPMPEGTQLHCVAHFDNSEENLVNPNPRVPVMWGDQTWEEMMVGTFGATLADQDLSAGRPRVRQVAEDRFEVRFRYRPETAAKHVYLAGSFNEWSPASHAMDGPDAGGWYSTVLELAPGRHEYKFVIDGETWKSDPGNPDDAGFYHNSVLWAGPRGK
jgi:hypothetical protein